MVQPHHIHLLCICYRQDLKNLSLFPHHHAIYLSDILHVCLHLRSIAREFVTLLVFAHHPCIQYPQDLHNTTFAIVFLPQMPHVNFLLDGFIVICLILLP